MFFLEVNLKRKNKKRAVARPALHSDPYIFALTAIRDSLHTTDTADSSDDSATSKATDIVVMMINVTNGSEEARRHLEDLGLPLPQSLCEDDT